MPSQRLSQKPLIRDAVAPVRSEEDFHAVGVGSFRGAWKEAAD
jgi:hypothetical protein